MDNSLVKLDTSKLNDLLSQYSDRIKEGYARKYAITAEWAVREATKRDWFGWAPPALVDPTPDEAIAWAKKNLSFFYDDSEWDRKYQLRFMNQYKRIIDAGNANEVYMTVEDYNHFIAGSYNNKVCSVYMRHLDD